MSNIQDNSQPKQPSSEGLNSGGLTVDVQSHLGDAHCDEASSEEEPEPGKCGLAPLPEGYADALVAAVKIAAESAGIVAGEIEIAVVDDARIHELNRRHLDHDWETDVISFPYELHENFVSGELIISWETASREAQVTGWAGLTELVLYAIHGTLHLVGMDDQDETQRAEMRRAELAVLGQLRPVGFERYDVSHRGQTVSISEVQRAKAGSLPGDLSEPSLEDKGAGE